VSIFFYFFNCDFARFGRKNKKKSTLIRNVTKLFTSSICTFIEVSVKFRTVLNKFQFILIFRPKRVKSQLELHLSATKPEAVNLCRICQRQLTTAGGNLVILMSKKQFSYLFIPPSKSFFMWSIHVDKFKMIFVSFHMSLTNNNNNLSFDSINKNKNLFKRILN